MEHHEYSIKALADLSGVTTRTLRWYDETGLLKPARVTEAGYRIYGPSQADRLQHILFYRALGLELSAIRAVLDDPQFDRQAALQSHLDALVGRRAQLDALILTVQNTLDAEKGGKTMSDTEKFACFKQNVIRENEEAYGEEIRGRFGDATVDASNERFAALTPEAYQALETLGGEIREKLKEAVRTGESPAGEVGAALSEQHRQWLCGYWTQYNPAAHRGLAQAYVDDPRFTAYYDSQLPGCARFLRDAILAHIK